MTGDLPAAEAALFGSGAVAKADYLRWARSPDLATRARAFHLSAHAWDRIAPEPGMDEQCEVMADYLLACIARDPEPDGFIHSGVEAGHVLAACLKHWSLGTVTADVIAGTAKKLERLYRESDARGRDRIETGALEHILESPRLRSCFEHWARDLELRAAHGRALQWGRAHTDELDA